MRNVTLHNGAETPIPDTGTSQLADHGHPNAVRWLTGRHLEV